ncbi:MAG TPA: DUF2339 domain-containing protein [Pedobacter sp.]|nr:DUF2339 domain-containing protein [Pedobacter sp.]
MNHSEHLNLLLLKLENLQIRHEGFEAEIKALKEEVRSLQSPGIAPERTVPAPSAPAPDPDVVQPAVHYPPKKPESVLASSSVPAPLSERPVFSEAPAQPNFANKFKRENLGKSDFEKFIGENLISKLGILILILGVAVGAKYAIDHDMVSPLTRIVLGYLVGICLMAFAIKLKAKYESFSAVLVSGAIAIMYFITYAAYDFYGLIPQAMAFALMVIFTSFSVVAATQYNKQVIAHIGLVGAYAVPFLLSDGSGKVVVLFSYMAIINVGILILSFKKYWKPLFYVSFGLTWLIFLAWRFELDSSDSHFNTSLLFSALFFMIFYVTNLAYKVSKAETFGFGDVVIILLNSFIYYGIGYFILSENKTGAELLGIFTLINAIIHFVVSLIIYKRKLADKKLFYLILAMVITFITMAVPVQLNGGWVTVFWAVEAAILFYLGREKKITIYERLSFPLIFLAFLSLLQDWTEYLAPFGDTPETIKPILNVGFLMACIFIAAFTWMLSISRKQIDDPHRPIKIDRVLSFAIPSILAFVTYMTFRIEIVKYFDGLLVQTQIRLNPSQKTDYPSFASNYDYELLKTAWIFIYSLFFTAALILFNLKKLKNENLAIANILITLVVILAFLLQGLYNLSELRESYLLQGSKYFISGSINIVIRYISFAFFALLLFMCYRLSRSGLTKQKSPAAFDYLLYISLLWILSSELINIISLSGLSGSYKLGLSILWGVYALFLISIGLAKKKNTCASVLSYYSALHWSNSFYMTSLTSIP